ncbi:MAG: polysaccharide biosynthesis protein [Bacteroidaceae bacterium]|nr:polysaccharide biosynthesis protein [Bacteroidaceae bacterium]
MKSTYKLFSWYFKRSALPYWIILLLDCLIIYVSSVFVYWLYFGGAVLQQHFYPLLHSMLLYLAVCIVCFRVFNTYSGIIRYSSFVDLQRVAYANISALLLVVALHYAVYRMPSHTFAHLTTRHLLLTFLIATAFMWAERVLVKILYDVVSDKERAQKVFIYGVHDGGVALAKSIRSQRPTRFILKGFISPQEHLSHHMLMGVKVYNNNEELQEALEKQHVKAVLISPIRKREFRNDQDLQDMLIAKGIKLYMVEEQVQETKDGKLPEALALKEVSVEDLLPRDEIEVDMESVARALAGKRVLITGAAGSIGSEIVRQVADSKPAAMMLIDQAETPEHDIRLMMQKQYAEVPAETIVTSICNPVRMEKIFSEFRPDYVFHAAAYKHVPMMEDNPGEAILNNVYGTKVVADLSVKYGAQKFVMISTDKAVNPTNVMGCSKRICEIYVQSLNKKISETSESSENSERSESSEKKTQFVTTRFGNVLGSNGSVIPLFREQIKKGGPVTVTDPNIIRFFMLIPEACKLVLEAGTKGNGGEIFVFDMGNPVKIAELAKRMIRLSGAQGVEVKFTGLRPGEKLYEEVLNDMESTKPTFHEKIRIASVREYDFDEISRDIDQLIETARTYDDMTIVKAMKLIVPEFKSNNSKYEILDKKD